MADPIYTVEDTKKGRLYHIRYDTGHRGTWRKLSVPDKLKMADQPWPALVVPQEWPRAASALWDALPSAQWRHIMRKHMLKLWFPVGGSLIAESLLHDTPRLASFSRLIASLMAAKPGAPMWWHKKNHSKRDKLWQVLVVATPSIDKARRRLEREGREEWNAPTPDRATMRRLLSGLFTNKIANRHLLFISNCIAAMAVGDDVKKGLFPWNSPMVLIASARAWLHLKHYYDSGVLSDEKARLACGLARFYWARDVEAMIEDHVRTEGAFLLAELVRLHEWIMQAKGKARAESVEADQVQEGLREIEDVPSWVWRPQPEAVIDSGVWRPINPEALYPYDQAKPVKAQRIHE